MAILQQVGTLAGVASKVVELFVGRSNVVVVAVRKARQLAPAKMQVRVERF